MKKFLAALLVVVMVVSMIPATVFAASSCPVEKAFGTHSKAYCDLKGVKYEQFGEAVEGKCGQDGYTMYKCKCGAYFADDIVDMPEHEHAVGAKPVVARVEPTCTKEGQAAMYLCINCNEQYAEYKEGDVKSTDKDAPAGALAMVDHKWGSPSGASTNCTATVVKCTVCGAINPDHKPEKEEHDFDYEHPKAFVKDPTNCEPGIVTFKCKNCNFTKDVAVDVTGHTKATTKLVAAVPGTCDTAGVKEHYKCEECGAKFLEQKDGSLKLASDADLATEIGHTYGNTPNFKTLPTCTSFGVEYYFCTKCGVPKTTDPVAPIGHTTYEQALAHDSDKKKVEKDGEWITVTKAKGCEDQTTYTWSCHQECYCNADPNAAKPAKAVCGYVGELTTKKDPAKGHNKTFVEIPATIENPVSYTLVLCSNKGCEVTPISPVTLWEDAKGTTHILPTQVKKENGNVFELTTEEKKTHHVIDVIDEKLVDLSKATDCPAHFYELQPDLNDQGLVNKPATCLEVGYNIYFCDACNETIVKQVPALGHNYDLDNGATVKGGVYKCDEEVYIVCANKCGIDQKHKNGLGHKFSDKYTEVKVPNCKQSAGKYYYCTVEGCDEFEIVGEVKYEYNPYFTTLKDAEAAHGKVADGELILVKTVAGDCVKVGHNEYLCTKCAVMIWVLDETTGKHLMPTDTVIYDKDTCEYGKGHAAYICARPECKAEVPAAKPALGHKWEKHERVEPTCTKDGNIEYYTCSRKDCVCCYEKDSKNKLQPSKYTYDETTDTYTKIPLNGHILPKTGCNIETTTVQPNCTIKGFTHEVCKNNCGYERVYNVIKALGHIEGEKIVKNPTCTEKGSVEIKCTRTGCDKNYIASKTDIPALGHFNAAGEKITNKCNDTVTDRVCVECNKKDGCANCADIVLNEKTKKYEVKKMHKEVDKDFAATCTTPAYTLTTCEYGCGDINKVEYKGKANGHKFAWGEKAGIDYVNAKIFADKTEEFLLNPANGITAYTPATNKASGSVTFKCADCKAAITMEVKKVGVDISMTIDNAVVPYANYTYDANGVVTAINPVDGDVLAFYIDINAFETDVWGLNFDVKYNAKGMKFLGYYYSAEELFPNLMVNNVLKDDPKYEDVNNDGIKEVVELTKNAEGTVKISAYTENDIDGKTHDAKINGVNEFITLFFQVQSFYEYTEKGVAYVGKDNFVDIKIEKAAVVNANGEVEAYGNSHKHLVTDLMDTNNNKNFNITDVQNCVKIIKGESEYEYLPACDVNKDGVVNLIDLDLMNKYLVGSADAFEIYNALSWKTPEGFVAA